MNVVHDRTRLLHRAVAKIRIDENTGCWVWTASTNKGYGQLSRRHGASMYKAHRLVYELVFGDLSDELVVRHKCDNPACCNPAHLEAGTQKDNCRDTSRRGRLNPASQANLRPGAPGFHGAGPISRREIEWRQ